MNEYEDIIHLPHHQSTSRPHMSMSDRAAQFAPFAALTGYSSVISDAAGRHIDGVNAQQFETDPLLVLLAEQNEEEYDE